ncbi:MAG: DEAD/DEAH box helicase [Methylococcaceae bacterium]
MKIILKSKIEIQSNSENEQQIIDKFTFNNPKYQNAISFGRSTRRIDKQICLIEKSNNAALHAPLGTLDYLVEMFNPEIIDNRFESLVEIPFVGILRKYQESFIDKAIDKKGGLMVAATGSGKTVSGLALASRLKQRTLILVKSKDLAEQWKEAIQRFNHCDSGLIGGGSNEEGQFFTVALIQTMIKKDLSHFNYGLVICDEAHNIPSNQAYKVINGLNAKYKYGLSATPQRRDNMEFMITGAIGGVCSEIEQNQLEGKVLPVHVSAIEIPFNAQVDSWAEFINVLVDDEQRNQVIVDRAVKSSEKMGTVVLCAQVRHCELLGVMCNESGVNPLVLHGQLPAKTRAERMSKIQTAPLVIGTLSLLSEGIDVPNLSALIFAAPVSASIDRDNPAATRLIQSIGRIRRPFKSKSKSYVLDIIDQCGFGVSAFDKRMVIYEKQGFGVTQNG